jgi:aryl-alcohol dehydrogenase-like predicted oxidoreductase
LNKSDSQSDILKLSLNKHLAIGTAQFGQHYGIANKAGQIDITRADQILKYAGKAGIDTLDTAIVYGDSEDILGKIGVSDWNIVSKIPAVPIDTRDTQGWIIDNVQSSLKRLNIEKYKCLMLHSPKQLSGSQGNEIFKALSLLKYDGLCDQIGISIYHPYELDEYLQYYRFDLVQAPFNIVDRRLFTSGWLHRLVSEDIEIHVRSIFLQGLLLMNPTLFPDGKYYGFNG